VALLGFFATLRREIADADPEAEEVEGRLLSSFPVGEEIEPIEGAETTLDLACVLPFGLAPPDRRVGVTEVDGFINR
jgi:hypothetical protein